MIATDCARVFSVTVRVLSVAVAEGPFILFTRSVLMDTLLKDATWALSVEKVP